MTVGVFNSALFTQDLAKKSFAGMITRLMPNGAAPLFGMTAMLNSDTALQSEHGFFTKTMVFPSFQCKANCSTYIFRASDMNGLAVSFDNMFAYGKPKSTAREVDTSSFFRAVESFKYPGYMSFGDTNTIITDLNEHMPAIGVVNTGGDITTGFAIFN